MGASYSLTKNSGKTFWLLVLAPLLVPYVLKDQFNDNIVKKIAVAIVMLYVLNYLVLMTILALGECRVIDPEKESHEKIRQFYFDYSNILITPWIVIFALYFYFQSMDSSFFKTVSKWIFGLGLILNFVISGFMLNVAARTEASIVLCGQTY